ncbi:hypothetical protein [Geobacter sp.]|uniref:hypothetical protein n=1 Tax=Geobacter sp. TaxID=46610 RepID=UPI003451EBA4
MTHDTIDHVTLQRLVEAGAVRGADVIGQPGGWEVVIKYGMVERALAVRRGAVRIFRHFETLVAYLKEIGISQYTVNAADYDPATPVRKARPDISERMKRAHEAAEYDKWFRAQVEEAIKEADMPGATWISNDDVKAESAKRRKEWAKRAKGSAA